MPYRFGGERKTQVVPAVAFAGAHRRLPLIRADEGGQAYVPAGFLAGFAQRGLLQAFVGLQVAGGLVEDEAAVAVFLDAQQAAAVDHDGGDGDVGLPETAFARSEEHTSELQSLMRIS